MHSNLLAYFCQIQRECSCNAPVNVLNYFTLEHVDSVLCNHSYYHRRETGVWHPYARYYCHLLNCPLSHLFRVCYSVSWKKNAKYRWMYLHVFLPKIVNAAMTFLPVIYWSYLCVKGTCGWSDGELTHCLLTDRKNKLNYQPYVYNADGNPRETLHTQTRLGWQLSHTTKWTQPSPLRLGSTLQTTRVSGR